MPEAKTPTRVPYLDLAAPHREMHSELHAALDRTLASGWLIGGPVLEEFEQAFAGKIGATECVGVANGLDALRLALLAAGVGPGDEVIVPSNTYIATWLAASQVGAVPIPVEPDPVSYNLRADLIPAALSPRTKAIIPVHLYGRCVDMAGIMAIAATHGLFVLEDAAQAFGASYRDRFPGALGHAAAWSFYPGKNLGALGDAGAVTTDDTAFAERLRVLRNYGSRQKYFNEVRGWNSRLDPLQAAFLIAKLRHVDGWWERRDALARRYEAGLRGIDGITTPEPGADGRHGWHIYAVMCKDRQAVCRALDETGIGWLIHYPTPPGRSEAYYGTASATFATPVAEHLAAETLSLPLHPYLSDTDQDLVIAAVRGWNGAR